MESLGSMETENATGRKSSILYPTMLIAAIAVIILSVLGIATMTGHMPSALSKNAGHEIEKGMNKSVSYQVRVRMNDMNDGTYRTFYGRSQPALAVGQKARVTSKGVVAAG